MTQQSKPFSIRFPQQVTEIITNLSRVKGKTPSDLIREAVEIGLGNTNDFQGRVAFYARDRVETIKSIFRKVESDSGDLDGIMHGRALPSVAGRQAVEEISMEEAAALMMFWHDAYLETMVNRNVNPVYVLVLLDMTKELLVMAQKNKVDLEYDHIRTCLDSRLASMPLDQIDFNAEIDSVKEKFLASKNAGHAEMITRPLHVMAYYLPSIVWDRRDLSKIFTSGRMKLLLPVLVHYAGSWQSIDKFANQLPSEVFRSDGIGFQITKNLTLVIDDTHSSYIFKARSVLDLFSMLEQGYDLQDEFDFATRSVQVYRCGQVMFHEHGGYRLLMPAGAFLAFTEKMRTLASTPEWAELISAYRLVNGDI